MNPGESIWLRQVGKDGRIFKWLPYSCPSSGGQSLATVNIATEVVQTAAQIGIWYELRKTRKVQENILEIDSANFEERRLKWLFQAMQVWIEYQNASPGLDLSSSTSLKKEIIGVLQALSKESKMDVPQVLLFYANDIQNQLQPRVELAFNLYDEYRRFALSNADKLKSSSNNFNQKIKYWSGKDKTKHWLSVKSIGELEKIKDAKNRLNFFEKIFGGKSSIAKKETLLKLQQETVRKYQPFQNLINELENIFFISKQSKIIHSLLPEEYKRELFLVASEKPQNFVDKLLKGPKPIIDEKTNKQEFKIIRVPNNDMKQT